MRTRKQILLAKVETTEGVDAAPVAGSDAVLVNEIKLAPQGSLIDSNELRGVLDAGTPIVPGVSMQTTCEMPLKGGGGVAVAPEFGRLLRACAMKETTATVIPSTGVSSVTGGTTKSFTLDTALETQWPTASGIASGVIGRPVELSVNPVVPFVSFVIDYQVSAGIATVTLADTLPATLTTATKAKLLASMLYRPSSVEADSVSDTFYVYVDGLLWKVLANRGDVEITLTSGQKGSLAFTFSGLLPATAKSDAALPSATWQSIVPQAWRNGAMTINSVAAAAKDFKVKLNNKVILPDDPNQVEGFSPPVITERDIQGSVTPLLTLVATRDAFADFRAGTMRALHARYGSVVGNRVGITVPAAMYQAPSDTDRDGLVAVDVAFKATGTDSGFTLAFY